MSSLTGSFLVARPNLRDPNFRQTVILLLAHSDDGAFGVVVNRPTPSEPAPLPLFWGGPCPSPGVILVHGYAAWQGGVDEDEEEVANSDPIAPGIYLGDARALERAAKEKKASRTRLFRNYSGWGPGQLEGELHSGSWEVVQADSELLFESPVDKLWMWLAPPSLPRPSAN